MAEVVQQPIKSDSSNNDSTATYALNGKNEKKKKTFWQRFRQNCAKCCNGDDGDYELPDDSDYGCNDRIRTENQIIESQELEGTWKEIQDIRQNDKNEFENDIQPVLQSSPKIEIDLKTPDHATSNNEPHKQETHGESHTSCKPEENKNATRIENKDDLTCTTGAQDQKSLTKIGTTISHGSQRDIDVIFPTDVDKQNAFTHFSYTTNNEEYYVNTPGEVRTAQDYITPPGSKRNMNPEYNYGVDEDYKHINVTNEHQYTVDTDHEHTVGTDIKHTAVTDHKHTVDTDHKHTVGTDIKHTAVTDHKHTVDTDHKHSVGTDSHTVASDHMHKIDTDHSSTTHYTHSVNTDHSSTTHYTHSVDTDHSSTTHNDYTYTVDTDFGFTTGGDSGWDCGGDTSYD